MFDAKAFLKDLTTKPGVYVMSDAKGKVIYVGKAKNLKRRVSSYFNRKHDCAKTAALVENIAHIDINIAPSEAEALILENTLIKKHKPKYNIIFRDDKSYPYLQITTQKEFPQLIMYRGQPKKQGLSFGPYPTMASTKETAKLLQAIFNLRDCKDHFFANRKRPCLQYQIQRCRAPCVGLVSKEEYDEDVRLARLFLEGRNEAVLKAISEKMENASENMEFELAAKFRDQLIKLQKLQEQQSVYTTTVKNLDVIALSIDAETACVNVMYVRSGKVIGNKSYFHKLNVVQTADEILTRFIEQLYIIKDRADDLDEIICRVKCDFDESLLKLISTKSHFKINSAPRKMKLNWLKMAELNAKEKLQSHLANKTDWQLRFEHLARVFKLANVPSRVECVDISHTGGEETVASVVVFNGEGVCKDHYRRFNIKEVAASDDYAAIYQVVYRRLKRMQEENNLPDLFLIDGGKGQLTQAIQACKDLNITSVELVAISKGPTRKIGWEKCWTPHKALPIQLEPDDPAMHVVQHIRDESHRFAITGHKNKRDKKRKTSGIEDIPGVGPKRRKALLNHFGSFDAVKKASVDELCKVQGISEALAKEILG